MGFKLWISESSGERNWVPGDPLTDKSGKPIVLYHGTDKKFSKFSLKKSTMGIIWLTSNRAAIEAGDVGAQGRGHIVSALVSLKNPAGWDEYDKLMLAQLKSQGYDGAVLDGSHGHFDVFVFHPNQIKIIGWD